MDNWKFYDITHREHVLCNPMNLEKFEQIIALLRLKPGARVLEIAPELIKDKQKDNLLCQD